MRPPPTSTLFPYTTLFRSLIDGGNSNYKDDIRRADELKAAGIRYLDVGTSGGVLGLEQGFCLMIDRKSTRLNSSHEWISYAVFCLKKKKNISSGNVSKTAW